MGSARGVFTVIDSGRKPLRLLSRRDAENGSIEVGGVALALTCKDVTPFYVQLAGSAGRSGIADSERTARKWLEEGHIPNSISRPLTGEVATLRLLTELEISWVTLTVLTEAKRIASPGGHVSVKTLIDLFNGDRRTVEASLRRLSRRNFLSRLPEGTGDFADYRMLPRPKDETDFETLTQGSQWRLSAFHHESEPASSPCDSAAERKGCQVVSATAALRKPKPSNAAEEGDRIPQLVKTALFGEFGNEAWPYIHAWGVVAGAETKEGDNPEMTFRAVSIEQVARVANLTIPRAHVVLYQLVKSGWLFRDAEGRYRTANAAEREVLWLHHETKAVANLIRFSTETLRAWRHRPDDLILWAACQATADVNPAGNGPGFINAFVDELSYVSGLPEAKVRERLRALEADGLLVPTPDPLGGQAYEVKPAETSPRALGQRVKFVRGDVVRVEIRDARGSETFKSRPVLVLSTFEFSANSGVAMVVPLTSSGESLEARGLCLPVRIEGQPNSRALIGQVQTLDLWERGGRLKGRVLPEDITPILEAVKALLD